MTAFTILARCTNGHESKITVSGYHRDDAVQLARVMDGTSDLYISSPRGDADSGIGRCGICRAQFDCRVID